MSFIIRTDNRKYARITLTDDPTRFSISLTSSESDATSWPTMEQCNQFRLDFLAEIRLAGCKGSESIAAGMPLKLSPIAIDSRSALRERRLVAAVLRSVGIEATEENILVGVVAAQAESQKSDYP